MTTRGATIVVVANSPGEVAGWARPLVASLRRAETRVVDAFGGGLEIVVVLPPCPFASGAEPRVVAAMPGVDTVVTPSEYVKFALFGVVPKGLRRAVDRSRTRSRGSGRGGGIVVHLGGDHAHSAILARRLGFPAVTYSDRTVALARSFARFMVEDARVRDKLRRKGVPPGRIDIVGNLMIDAVQAGASPGRHALRRALGADGRSLLVCLLPGSRRQQIAYGMPLFLRVAEIVARSPEAAAADVGFVMVLSPFVTVDALAEALADARARRSSPAERVAAVPGRRALDGTGGVLTRSGESDDVAACTIVTDEGVRIPVVTAARHAAMAACDAAIAMPGTVTAELAFLGVPTVVALPLNMPELVPLPGLLGIVGGIPLIGTQLRRFGVRRASRRVEFAAIPNRRERRRVTPEVRGVLTADDIASELAKLLRDPDGRARISVELRQAMGQPGAADRASAIILDMLVETGGIRR